MEDYMTQFFYAGFGGMISRTATAPLERLKVLYQNKKNIKDKRYFNNLVLFVVDYTFLRRFLLYNYI